MREYLLASHSNMAQGVKDSLELIMGKQENVYTLCAYVQSDYDLESEIIKFIKAHASSELVVITDLLGGSVNNEFLRLQTEFNYYLVTGLNLTVILELVTSSNLSAKEAIDKAVLSARKALLNCAELTASKSEDDF